jgi:hypothetical protein
MSGGTFVEIEIGEKNLLFSFCFWVWWVQFSTVAASIILPGAMWVVRLAGNVSVAVFLVSSRLGGRDLPGARLHTLRWFLSEKKACIL